MNVTDIAKEKIKKHLYKRGTGLGIRIGVKTTGCSGMAYVLEYVDQIAQDDAITYEDDFVIVVDPKSLVYLQDITIDYQKQGLNEGFEFINPLEKARCGCGESFTV
jgi:iron-sulfur cluster assembly protein